MLVNEEFRAALRQAWDATEHTGEDEYSGFDFERFVENLTEQLRRADKFGRDWRGQGGR